MIEKVDVKEEMEEEPSGRMMGMPGPRMRGRECCLQKEEEMTFPSAPQSIKIRAGAPATLPINDKRVREAFSTVNSCRRTDRCRKRLALRLDKDWSKATREESGSRSTSSDGFRSTDVVLNTLLSGNSSLEGAVEKSEGEVKVAGCNKTEVGQGGEAVQGNEVGEGGEGESTIEREGVF